MPHVVAIYLNMNRRIGPTTTSKNANTKPISSGKNLFSGLLNIIFNLKNERKMQQQHA
jgi:hypothetical protein